MLKCGCQCVCVSKFIEAVHNWRTFRKRKKNTEYIIIDLIIGDLLDDIVTVVRQ